MGIKAGKIIVNDKSVDKKTMMENRNISLVSEISRDKAIPYKSSSPKISVNENGVEKIVYRQSKYLDDLTKKGE